MFQRRQLTMVVVCAAMGVCALAGADLETTVTISGDLDEIIAVLSKIREMQGGEPAADEAMKVEVHSMMSAGEPAEPAATPTPAEVEIQRPELGLKGTVFEPAPVVAGRTCNVQVRVSDPFWVVDTVALRLETPGSLTADLYDNGRHGDETAGDGLWQREITIPADTPPGGYQATITAYDANGEPITYVGPDGQERKLTTNASLTVTTGPVETAQDSAVPAQ